MSSWWGLQNFCVAWSGENSYCWWYGSRGKTDLFSSLDRQPAMQDRGPVWDVRVKKAKMGKLKGAHPQHPWEGEWLGRLPIFCWCQGAALGVCGRQKYIWPIYGIVFRNSGVGVGMAAAAIPLIHGKSLGPSSLKVRFKGPRVQKVGSHWGDSGLAGKTGVVKPSSP